MRVLQFIVDDKTIEQNPSCNFNGLFPGTEDAVKVAFTFSPEWEFATKVVAFWSIMGNEYPPQVLDDNNCCMVPKEALSRPAFKIQVLGIHEKVMVETNKLTIYQRGGKR